MHALGGSFLVTNPKLAERPGFWEGIWPTPVIFSAPRGGGGGEPAQLPVVTTETAVAMSWRVKFARISRRDVGLSGPLSGPTPAFPLRSSEKATLAKCPGAKATWKRSARQRSPPAPRPPVD